MKHIHSVILSVAVVGLLTACPDPGAGKPKAKVAPAKGATSAPAKKADPAKKAAAPAGAGEQLTFDNTGGKLEWTAAKVTHSHPGGFKEFSGTIDLIGGKAEGSKVSVEIALASLFADNPKLGGHLQSPDFFDVAKFAKGTFTSTAIKAGGEGGASHTVTGDLGFHGVTKSVTFPATITVGDAEVSAKADFAINRQDWGLKYPGMPDDLIKDGVAIKFDVKAARKKAAAAAPAAAAPAAAPPAAAAKPAAAKPAAAKPAASPSSAPAKAGGK